MSSTKPYLFITGASGFIGSETVAQALDLGYRSRLTVRRKEQIDEIKARYPGKGDALDFVVVPDLSDSSALHKALDGGITHVLHIASPMPGNDVDLQTGYIEPAVKATTAVLNAAEGIASIHRVIITASVLSLAPLDVTQRPGFLVEEGKNREIEIDPNAQLPPPPFAEIVKYHISKVLAHRATLDWVAQHKPSFRVVTVHPVFVIGHDHAQTDAQPRGVHTLLMGSLASEKPLAPSQFVDVRDVAKVELRAVTVPEAALNADRTGVTEVLTGPNDVTWDQIVAVVQKKYPSFPLKLQGPFPEPPRTDNRRAERDFGVKWRSIEATISDVLDQQLALQAKA